MRAVAVGLHEADGEIDRRMIGHIEKKDLRRPDQQRGLDARRVLRQAALQQQAEEMAQAAEPPQHDRDQRPDQRTVAIRQAGKTGLDIRAFKLLVERTASPQHAVDDVGGDAPNGEAGRIGWRLGHALAGALAGVLVGRELGRCFMAASIPHHGRLQPSSLCAN